MDTAYRLWMKRKGLPPTSRLSFDDFGTYTSRDEAELAAKLAQASDEERIYAYSVVEEVTNA